MKDEFKPGVPVHVQSRVGGSEEANAVLSHQQAGQSQITQDLRSCAVGNGNAECDVDNASGVGMKVPVLVIAVRNRHGGLNQNGEFPVHYEEVFVAFDFLDEPRRSSDSTSVRTEPTVARKTC